jgi:hypothetical protein
MWRAATDGKEIREESELGKDKGDTQGRTAKPANCVYGFAERLHD